jgi:hypothetical protein
MEYSRHSSARAAWVVIAAATVLAGGLVLAARALPPMQVNVSVVARDVIVSGDY